MRFVRSLCRRMVPVALLSVFVFSSASGALLYDESVGGDVNGNQAAPTAVGTLLLGLNLVQGYDSTATDVGAQGDTFTLLLPAGMTVQSIALTLTNYTGSNAFAATLLRYGPFHVYQQYSGITGNGVFNYTVASIMSPATLGFSTQLQTTTEPTGANWQWAITTTSAVPETSSAQLLGAGLAALGVWSRWRRRRS